MEDAGEEEIESAAAVSVAEAEAELAAAGFDVAAERAKAEAFLASLEQGAAEPVAVAQEAVVRVAGPPRSARGERRNGPSPVVLWAAVAAAAVAGGAIYAALHQAPTPAPEASPLPPSAPPRAMPRLPSDLAVAADLRHQAAAACDAQKWSECLAQLDQARASDPDGDDTPVVTKLRDSAMAGILKKPKPSP